MFLFLCKIYFLQINTENIYTGTDVEPQWSQLSWFPKHYNIFLFVFMWRFGYIKNEPHRLYLIRSHIHILRKQLIGKFQSSVCVTFVWVYGLRVLLSNHPYSKWELIIKQTMGKTMSKLLYKNNYVKNKPSGI